MALFYFDNLPQDATELVIEGEEARHMAAAQRLRVDDQISLTDGYGVRVDATIIRVDNKPLGVKIRIDHRQVIDSPTPELIIAGALPKGDRQSVMLDMLTQLGMSRFIPLHCTYSVSKPGSNSRQRMQRRIISACKQSQRCHFPVVGEVMQLNELLQEYSKQALCMVADIAGESTGSVFKSLSSRPDKIIMLVGPEGGFSIEEFAAMETAGVRPVRLGEHILRTETACAAMIAATHQGLSLIE